ncbi:MULTISPECIES: hypothetical protein [unclassified Nocardia]|uniref:hypothetical protein n=1 Tax=unclassified Nocardia TaxID=2637762 RepID=UPI001CE402CF|nr:MULTISPECIES: hypothetical protein [unclassified Nocardia]
MPEYQADREELGLKVQRAQHELAQIRGIGVVDGVTVEVDAENRLLAVSVPNCAAVLAAYAAAIQDKEPKVAHAMRDLTTDPRVQSVRIFVDANASQPPAEDDLDTSVWAGSAAVERVW